MKYSISFIFVLVASLSINAQNVVYDPSGKKISFSSEKLLLNFSKSNVNISPTTQQEFFPALVTAMLPTLIDVGFKLTSSALEGRVKKFSADYTKQSSYLEAGDRFIPDFDLRRKITTEGKDEKALTISFRAAKIDKIDGFIFYVDSVNLYYSSARATSKNKSFDYTIEIKPTFLKDGKKETLEIPPIVISSVKFGNNPFSDQSHRSDIIPITEGAILSGVSVKVVETNPAKIRAEKILALWNNNKDNAKTIINNILPADKSQEEAITKGANGKTGTNTTDGVKTKE